MAKDPHPHSEPDDQDLYDIVEPVDEEPTTRFDPGKAKRAEEERLESGVDLDIDTDSPPPPLPSGADYATEEAAKPRPKLLEGIPEPKFVDPEVQSRRREEARVAAVQREAEEDARRRALKMKIAGTVLLVLMVIGTIVYVMLG